MPKKSMKRLLKTITRTQLKIKNLNKQGVDYMRNSKNFMSERVQELENERNTALEEKETVLRFIEETKNIPSIVLVTLKQKIRKLDITLEDCELRLKNYE